MVCTSSTRTRAQLAASRLNGAKGRGPTTPKGLLASSANALRHGAYSRALLGPGLDVETVRAAFDSWVESFAIRSPPAYQLAARGAAATLRLDQVDAIREKVLAEVLEHRVAASQAATDLASAQQVRAAVAGLAGLAGDVRDPVLRHDATKLLPALQAVVQGVLELPVVAGAGYSLAASVGLIDGEGIDDISPEVFAEIARTSIAILAAIDAAISEMERKVEVERVRQAELLVVADDKRLREVDRVRGRLVKEIEAIARALGAIKDLEVEHRRPVDPGPLPPIEFKIVGS